MAKKTAPEAGSEQKVMTKYDLKMEKRRKQKKRTSGRRRLQKLFFLL